MKVIRPSRHEEATLVQSLSLPSQRPLYHYSDVSFSLAIGLGFSVDDVLVPPVAGYGPFR